MDWNKPAYELHNQVRGLNPWPSASFMLDGKTMKVHRTRVGTASAEPPGTVISLQPLTVACGGGTSLELAEIQYEGAKRMSSADFLRGHPVPLGSRL